MSLYSLCFDRMSTTGYWAKQKQDYPALIYPFTLSLSKGVHQYDLRRIRFHLHFSYPRVAVAPGVLAPPVAASVLAETTTGDHQRSAAAYLGSGVDRGCPGWPEYADGPGRA